MNAELMLWCLVTRKERVRERLMRAASGNENIISLGKQFSL